MSEYTQKQIEAAKSMLPEIGPPSMIPETVSSLRRILAAGLDALSRELVRDSNLRPLYERHGELVQIKYERGLNVYEAAALDEVRHDLERAEAENDSRVNYLMSLLDRERKTVLAAIDDLLKPERG